MTLGRSACDVPTSTVEVWDRVLDLLAEPSRWYQGWFAADTQGFPCEAVSCQAVCYCTLGAVSKVTRGAPALEFDAVTRLTWAVACLGYGSVPSWNDHPDRTHAEVLDLVRTLRAKAAETPEEVTP